MPDTPFAVQVHGLVRDFGPLRALDDVSLSVPAGEVMALLGHNGAGKTTLLRVINGLLRPTQGSVRILGLDPATQGQSVRSRTGILTEYPALDDFLTVRENLLAYGEMYGLDAATVTVRGPRLLDALGLADRTHTRTRDLSAGLKQRAALARAMLHEPELLLLDEPTSNLDPLAARQVRDLVAARSRRDGTTVVVSTHNLAEAAAIADRVVVLHHGRVLLAGRVDDLTSHGSRPRVTVTTSTRTYAVAVATATAATGDVEELRTAGTFSVATQDVPASSLVATLVHQGVDVLAVVPQAPTLEDVYLSLHADPAAVPTPAAVGAAT